MTSELAASRQIPLANAIGRQIQDRGSVREWILSAALHAAIVAAIILAGTTFEEVLGSPGAGSGRGGGGGGGGNRAFAVFALPASASATIPPPPPLVVPDQLSLQVPVVKPPDPEIRPPSAAELAAQAVTSAGPGEGPGQGVGTGPGAGSGTGGGVGSGVGPGVGADSGGAGRIFPPQLQGMILPPQPVPGGLKGTRVTARFEISERGEVLSVELDPPIRDRSYRNELLERLRHYNFTPAFTLDGRAVRAVYPILITL